MSFFDFVKAPSLQKYEYTLDNDVKMSGRIGDLIPFNWDFLCPGDTVEKESQVFLRTAPLIHPIFQKMNIDVHHFFIPLRLIWDDFETFITGFNQKDASPIELSVPNVIMSGNNLYNPENFEKYIFDNNLSSARPLFGVTSLADYLGLPCSELPLAFGQNPLSPTPQDYNDGRFQAKELAFSVLPFRAYQQVFNDYYRDSIKEREIPFKKDSIDLNLGIFEELDVEDVNVFTLRQRALEKDYFTTSQPTPQLGEDIVLSTPNLQGSASRVFPAPTSSASIRVDTNGYMYTGPDSSPTLVQSISSIPSTVLVTINKLRELFSLQRWADNGNKFGSRYKEQTLGHFGVETPDARLQRAEYLGGGRIPLMINQVSQLSEGTEDSPLGTQAGQGMASGSDNFIKYEAKEHGILLSIISVLPENTYYKGVPKKFLIRDRFDFPFPEFATLGEQEVSSMEMNVFYPESDTYGYQERYAEFKQNYNSSAGEFTTNLRNFYLASPQSSNSCLDVSNIRLNPEDYDNVFPVDARQADNMYFLISNSFKKYSPLPYINRVTTDYV